MIASAGRLLTLGLTLLVAGAWPNNSGSAEARVGERSSAFPDIERVFAAGYIRVALLARDAAPMIMTDAQGAPAGSEPDLARDLAKKLGVDVVFLRSAESYDGVVDLVAGREADIAVSYLSGGMERARRVLFSRPYVRQSGRLVYNRARFAELKRDYGVETIRAIEGVPIASSLRLGVIAGSVYESNLERDFPASRLQRFDSLPEMLDSVRSGETFSALHGSLQIDYFMRRNPASAIRLALDPEIRQSSDIRIAVRPDAPNLLRWINLYLETHVGVLEDAEIVRRYLGLQADPQ
jgi:ABC-type amino acid transport substrate-binding protein